VLESLSLTHTHARRLSRIRGLTCSRAIRRSPTWISPTPTASRTRMRGVFMQACTAFPCDTLSNSETNVSLHTPGPWRTVWRACRSSALSSSTDASGSPMPALPLWYLSRAPHSLTRTCSHACSPLRQGTHCPDLRRLHVGGTMITYYTMAALSPLDDIQDIAGTLLLATAHV
jgi:hypothetical protein